MVEDLLCHQQSHPQLHQREDSRAGDDVSRGLKVFEWVTANDLKRVAMKFSKSLSILSPYFSVRVMVVEASIGLRLISFCISRFIVPNICHLATRYFSQLITR